MSNIKSPQRKMRFWKNLILLALFVVAVNYWLKTKSYLFDEKTIVAIGNRHISARGVQQLRRVVSELEERYPGHIVPRPSREWIMIKTGGWVGSIYVLHASLTEYLVLTGTAIDSQGHSGRHWLNITHVLLTGSVVEWKEGTLQAVTHSPGDTITFKWGTASSLHWKANSWTLEYGRGFIPFSMPFSFADSIFSSFDLLSIFRLFKAFVQAYYFELKGEIAHFIASI